MKKSNPIALLPIGVFLVLYLGLGILFEYVLKIPMGFYNIPIIIAFLAAILVACLQNRSVKFDEKLELMAQGLADRKYHHDAADLPDSGNICRCCRSEQCGECGIFYAGTDPDQICRCCLICCGVLCIDGNGNVCRNDHASDADRGCCLNGIRV